MITSKNNLNVFSGTNAIKDLLNPDLNPPLPLVEIPRDLNPFFDDGVHIYAKCMNFLPLGNVKSLPAYNMLLEENKKDNFKNMKNLIENSSGNTVFSLAVLGRLFGIPNTKAIVSHEVSWGKLQLLRLFGTGILVNEEPICPDPNSDTSGIYMAKRIAETDGWLNPGQYDNDANPEAHMKWTGPQIWKQTKGEITLLCAGLGTTGTMLGTSKYLKERSKSIQSIGVVRKPNNPVPGVRTPNLLQQIAFDWKKQVDFLQEIGTKESFETSLALCRRGLVVGPSSGFALAGLLGFLREQKESGNLNTFKNRQGKVIAVFVCPDNPLPYLEEYFEYLDDSYFPNIEQEELLINRPNKKGTETIETNRVPEISVEDTYERSYAIPRKELWQIVVEGGKIPLQPDVYIIDVRTDQEFEHFHIPGSQHVELSKLASYLSRMQRKLKDKTIFFVCKSGNRSNTATQMARVKNINAFNIRGGLTEWSRLNLPRVRPQVCTTNHSV